MGNRRDRGASGGVGGGDGEGEIRYRARSDDDARDGRWFEQMEMSVAQFYAFAGAVREARAATLEGA